MLGFGPRLPIPLELAARLERSGANVLEALPAIDFRARRSFLPDDAIVDWKYEGSEEDAERLVSKISAIMGAERPAGLVFTQGEGPTRFLEDGATLSLDTAFLAHRDYVVAPLARAMAFRLLMAAGRGEDAELDFEVEFVLLFMGFGLYQADTALQRRVWSEGNLRRSSLSTSGWLSEDALGAALALVATWRDEDPSPLADFLVPTASRAFTATRRFLEKRRLGLWGTQLFRGQLEDLHGHLVSALERKGRNPAAGAASSLDASVGSEAEEAPVLARVEILGAGTMHADAERGVGEDGRECWKLSIGDLDELTDRIPLVEGKAFGFMFRPIASRPYEAFEFEARFGHPAWIEPSTGAEVTEERFVVRAADGEVAYLGWGFFDPWTKVPGTWKVELLLDGQVVASRDFEMYDVE